MMKLLTKVIRNCNNEELTYVSGKLNFILTLDEPTNVSNGYTFTLYNDSLWQLLHAEAGDGQTKQKEGVFNVCFNKNIILLPGHYFLLFNVGELVLRFDLQMQKGGVLTNTEGKVCPRLSMEDILERRLSGIATWKFLASRPGLLQWKLWIIHRLQQKELNVFRSENIQWMLDYCNNLLISSETTDGLRRDVRLLCHLTEIKNLEGSTDCSTFCKATENPYKEIDNIFHVEYNNDNILGIPLPDSKEREYFFYNIGKILTADKEDVLDRILDYAPSTNNNLILCGTKKDIERLLELKPELQNQIPEYNRFGTETPGAEELIRTFFDELEFSKIGISPEGTDAACKFLFKKYDEGEICNWSFLDLRQYIRTKMIPAYTCRAITSIQEGRPSEEAVYIMPEDIVSL